MPMETAEVAARARTENFPIASVLFPRELRPHLRAIYGFARLVDILGDEVEGDRLAALDELERELDACYGEGAPSWPVMRRLEPTVRAFSLPREPFLGLIGRAGEPELVTASDDVCTGLQLVNFLQDVPRDLALGRVYLPADDRRRFGVLELDRPNEPLRSLLEFEAGRARGQLVSGGERLRAGLGGRIGRAVALFARGGVAALEALERADWDIFTQRPRPSRARLARAAVVSLVR